MEKAKLFRCKICGDPYVGDRPPGRCPFCGAYEKFIVEAKDFHETYDIEMTEKEKANVEEALQLEIGNAAFYFCAAKRSDNEENRQLFKALGKVEAEHASIWKKVLKLDKVDIPTSEACAVQSLKNLQESHDREDKAIKHYKQFAAEAKSERLKTLFLAIVQVETDHLHLSEERGIKNE